MARDTWARNAFARDIDNDENNIGNRGEGGGDTPTPVESPFYYIKAEITDKVLTVDADPEDVNKAYKAGKEIVIILRDNDMGLSATGGCVINPNNYVPVAFYVYAANPDEWATPPIRSVGYAISYDITSSEWRNDIFNIGGTY